MRLLLTSDFHFHKGWLDWLVKAARSGRWDAILLGGDIGNMNHPSIEQQRSLMSEVITQINEAGVPLFMCSGNHDPMLFGSYEINKLGDKLLEAEGSQEANLITTVLARQLTISICRWGFCEWSKLEPISERTDGTRWLILMHQPPTFHTELKGKAQKVLSEEQGMALLDEWIERLQPDYIFSGHIHHLPYVTNFATHLCKTWSLNAGQCETVKEPNHIDFDLSNYSARWRFYDPQKACMSAKSVSMTSKDAI